MSKYFGTWTNAGDVERDFAPYGDEGKGAIKDFPTDDEIRFAWYDYEDYSGDALVVFERDGELYEVNGSHCSCNGLEGDWHPARTVPGALAMRNVEPDPDHNYGPRFSPEAVAAFRALFPAAPTGGTESE